MSNYSDDKEYMAWWADGGEIASPRVEYGAWLAGGKASEASATTAERERDELRDELDRVKAERDTLQAQLDAANAAFDNIYLGPVNQ